MTIVKEVLPYCSEETVNAIEKSNGMTALYWACERKNEEMVELLMKKGAKKTVNRLLNKEETPPTADRKALKMNNSRKRNVVRSKTKKQKKEWHIFSKKNDKKPDFKQILRDKERRRKIIKMLQKDRGKRRGDPNIIKRKSFYNSL